MPLSAIEASELQEAHLTLPAQLEDLHRFLVRAPKLLQLKLECLPSGPINGSLSEAQPARWRELVNMLENSSVRKVTLTFTQSSVELQRSPDNTLSRLTLYNASGLYCADLVVSSLTRLTTLHSDSLTDKQRERLLKRRKG
jgi:hypothetical protein